MGRVLTLITLAVLLVSAKDHHTWQTGKVVDTQLDTRPFGLSTADWQVVAIGSGDYTYTGQRMLKFRWSKRANLTVNTPVKFAVEKQKLFLVDDDGKEYELDIFKRIKN